MLKYFSVLLGKIANGYVEVVGDCLLEEVKSPFENYGQLADGPTRRVDWLPLSMTRSSNSEIVFTRRKF